MNLNFENIKKTQVTIPATIIIACLVFVWNTSKNFNEFKGSVATDAEVSEVRVNLNQEIEDLKESAEDGLSTLERAIANQDKRILILEITNGTFGIGSGIQALSSDLSESEQDQKPFSHELDSQEVLDLE